jgi:hypothetical protein
VNHVLTAWHNAFARLEHWADRKLEPAITSSFAPPPAVGSLSPHRISTNDRPGRPTAAAADHCQCCDDFLPADCPIVHELPCDRSTCKAGASA